MSEYDYEDELVTSHSDENPEITGSERKPLALASNEGTAVSELYKEERNPFSYRPRHGEHVLEEDIFIPDVDHSTD
jgi:hypothetical protein